MSNKTLFKISYTARAQQGVWHSHDDWETTGYSEPKPQISYIVAPDKHYAETWFSNMTRHWSKEHEVANMVIENLGYIFVIDVR